MKEGAKFSSLRSNLRVCWVMAEVAIATALLSLLAPAARANGDLGVKCNTGAGTLHLPALIEKEVAA